MTPKQVLIAWMTYKAQICGEPDYFLESDKASIEAWSDELCGEVLDQIKSIAESYDENDGFDAENCCVFCVKVEIIEKSTHTCRGCEYMANHEHDNCYLPCGNPMDKVNTLLFCTKEAAKVFLSLCSHVK